MGGLSAIGAGLSASGFQGTASCATNGAESEQVSTDRARHRGRGGQSARDHPENRAIGGEYSSRSETSTRRHGVGALPGAVGGGDTQQGEYCESEVTHAKVEANVGRSARGATGPSDAGSPPGSEQRIAREVRHQLILLPYYGVFDNLAFRVNGSTVTLLGQVTRPTLKSERGGRWSSKSRVLDGDNQIEVLPLSPDDNRIRIAEYHAIYGQPALNQYALQAVPPIHIIVKNGNVTLVGAVSSEMDKNLAGIQANGVAVCSR